MAKVGTEGRNRARSPLYKLSYLAVTLLLSGTCGYDARSPATTGKDPAAGPQARAAGATAAC